MGNMIGRFQPQDYPDIGNIRDFKAFITSMLSEVRANALEMKGKIAVFSE